MLWKVIIKNIFLGGAGDFKSPYLNAFNLLNFSPQFWATPSAYSMFSKEWIKQRNAPVKRYGAHFSTFFTTLELLKESKVEEGGNARWWRTTEGRMCVAVGVEMREEEKGRCGRFFYLKAGAGEEPTGSAGSSRARPTSRKALSALIHYSATSTISLCQAIFTRSDKIDSVYKRMCSPPFPFPSHASPLIYLFIWHVNASEWYRCSFYPLTYSSGLSESLFRAV